MAGETAFAAYGTLLQMGDGAGTEVFATVAGVKDIAGPGVSRDTAESTSHSSPEGYEEFVATIKRSGEVGFDCNWNPADPTHDETTGMYHLAQADAATNFKLVYPRLLKAWSFKGIVTKWVTNAPVAGLLTASVTIKVTGRPTLATWSAP